MLDVWNEYRGADGILVDIPIGLPETGRRSCDQAAKDVLATSPERVFWTPPRDALTADTYSDAKEIVRERTDGSMTVQAWSLLPRIREVDTFLAHVDEARDTIRESHPEVVFAYIADGTSVTSSKLTGGGVDARLSILEEHDEGVTDAYRRIVDEKIDSLDPHERGFSASNRDDVVDAMGLAVVAALADGEYTTLPESPASDPHRDLPMEIVVHDPET